jgi:hypothetical protein
MRKAETAGQPFAAGAALSRRQTMSTFFNFIFCLHICQQPASPCREGLLGFRGFSAKKYICWTKRTIDDKINTEQRRTKRLKLCMRPHRRRALPFRQASLAGAFWASLGFFSNFANKN